jgi:hypothetical protein
MSDAVLGLSEDDLTRSLAYAGFVLLAYELVKSLIVDPIRLFYRDTTFSAGPFKSYELDVLSRHKNEFEACLLYLRDFMKAIDSDDVLAIQGLRKHRNDLAHDLPSVLRKLDVNSYAPLLEKADKALFKLSNYRTYMEIGHDPEFQDKGIDWDTVYGTEYMIFKEVVEKVRILQKATK